MPVNEITHILIHTTHLCMVESMLEEPEQILEAIRRRELDIEIMELQLKHNLTRKRAESKLLIMYYKACNAISRAKLMVRGVNGLDVKEPALNPVKGDHINRLDPWSDHQQKKI